MMCNSNYAYNYSPQEIFQVWLSGNPTIPQMEIIGNA